MRIGKTGLASCSEGSRGHRGLRSVARQTNGSPIFGRAANTRFANAYCRSIDPLIFFFVVFLVSSYFSLRRSLLGLNDFFVVGAGRIC